MGDREAAEEVRAAGAVVWRPAGSGAQIALVHRPKYDDWSLPKGKVEPGEHVLLAAVREVAEETALEVTLGRRLPSVSYWNEDVPKRVDYWAATSAQEVAPFEPNSEIDDLAWLPVSRAAARLSYERDTATLDSFRGGPRQTVPLILVRHASAGSKADWPGDDASRPLDSRGEADAQALARLLRCFGAGRVVSAPAERCVATLRPYAASFGGVIEIDAAFEVPPRREANRDAANRRPADRKAADRKADRRAPDRTAADRTADRTADQRAADRKDDQRAADRRVTDRRAAADRGAGDRDSADPKAAGASAAAAATAAAAAMGRLADDGRPVVICAHRENLPALMAAACAALGAPAPAGWALRKCEFAVLHRADGVLAALERYHPDGQSLVGRPAGAPSSGSRLGFAEPASVSGLRVRVRVRAPAR